MCHARLRLVWYGWCSFDSANGGRIPLVVIGTDIRDAHAASDSGTFLDVLPLDKLLSAPFPDCDFFYATNGGCALEVNGFFHFLCGRGHGLMLIVRFLIHRFGLRVLTDWVATN